VPRLSRWLVRASLVCLVPGAWLGAALLAGPVVVPASSGALLRLLPIHVELLVVGWQVQLALGVAFWILPRAGGKRPAAGPAALGGVLVAAGVIVSVAGVLASGGWGGSTGPALETIGAAAFGGHVVVRLRRWRRLDAERRRGVPGNPG